MAVALSRLTLGTAQFGMRYGIAGRDAPDDSRLTAMLAAAERLGITTFDTARGYGNAEERLGTLLSAHPRWTKISKISPVPDGADAATVVGTSIAASLAALHVPSIDVMMFHRGTDVALQGAVEVMADAIASGRISEVGASVYTVEEAAICLAQPLVQHLQIPFHILDSRWLKSEFQGLLADRPDVTIHARSVFLQGLLLMEEERWPDWVEGRGELTSSICALAKPLAGGVAELCLRFHCSFPWIATTVIGVDDESHLVAASEAVARGPLPDQTLHALAALYPSISERLLLPPSW